MKTDLRTDPIHLPPGGVARIVEDFGWDPERLGRYAADTKGDGADGRLVSTFLAEGTWTRWERHPNGDEVVIACTGRHVFTQERDDGTRQQIELGPGEALVNPAGVWHTGAHLETGWLVTITPGQGTEDRPG